MGRGVCNLWAHTPQKVSAMEIFTTALGLGTPINWVGRSRPPQPLFLRWHRGENLDFSRCPIAVLWGDWSAGRYLGDLDGG